MPKQAYRFGGESDEVLVYAEIAEPITATQKVLIVRHQIPGLLFAARRR